VPGSSVSPPDQQYQAKLKRFQRWQVTSWDVALLIAEALGISGPAMEEARITFRGQADQLDYPLFRSVGLPADWAQLVGKLAQACWRRESLVKGLPALQKASDCLALLTGLWYKKVGIGCLGASS
jgi:hypothetical protein